MSKIQENKTNSFPLKIWSETLDFLLLEGLQKRRVDINMPISKKIMDDIAKESFPKLTSKQCQRRLGKMKSAYLNHGPISSGILTQKVYDKLHEILSIDTGISDHQVGSLVAQPIFERIQGRLITKRIWNSEYDELLLDGLMRLESYNSKTIRHTVYAEIVQESLPNLTVDQCIYRWRAMQKIYKHRPDSHILSGPVMEKLNYFESMRPKTDENEFGIESPSEKQQETSLIMRIWTEEADLKLLNALALLHPELNKNVKTPVWRQISEKLFAGKIAAEQCKLRYDKLRTGYNKRKASGTSAGIWLFRKVYNKLCKLFENEPEPDICRCCGQITGNLIDLDKEGDKLEWFLAFTGLAAEQLVHPYTKICQICVEKLAQAHKFRDLCLMGDQIIQAELANKPPFDAPMNEGLFVDEIFNDGPPMERPPIRCTVCGDMVPMTEYKQHKRKHVVHEMELKNTCKICGKKYKNYKRHVEFHIDGQIHECPECPKKFNSVGNLKIHKKSHMDGPKGQQCTICGKFYTKYALKFHMAGHSGVKPCKCPHCGQQFSRVQSLNKHVKSRHDHVRYQCSYCDMKYSEKGNKMKMHILLRHEDAILRCNLCNLESTTFKSFNFHLKNRHRAAFNQSIHVILSNGERLIRRRVLDKALIQTTKIDLDAREPAMCE